MNGLFLLGYGLAAGFVLGIQTYQFWHKWPRWPRKGRWSKGGVGGRAIAQGRRRRGK